MFIGRTFNNYYLVWPLMGATVAALMAGGEMAAGRSPPSWGPRLISCYLDMATPDRTGALRPHSRLRGGEARPRRFDPPSRTVVGGLVAR